MIFLWMAGLAVLLSLPMLFAFRGGAAPARRREVALRLHAAQLEELARDLGDGRIAASEYEAAKLEVQRRVLAADAMTEVAAGGNAGLLLTAVVLAVPVLGFALYLPGSTPTVPSEPHTQWAARQQQEQARLSGFIAQLRMHLAGMDPNSVDASQGEAYLGEALAEQAGQVTPEAMALFKQSLGNAPAAAAWRELAARRVAQAAGP